MALGYRLPGTTITEVTVPQSVNTSSTQRTPCFIGLASDYVKVNYEAVVRSSTGLADNLDYTSTGIYSITAIGSQQGLSNFTEGTDFDLTDDQIVWTSAGLVTTGATYYVSYYYDRPEDQYGLYKEFTNYEAAVADLGADLPANTLVMIAKLALRTYNVPKIAVVQVAAMNANNVDEALTEIKYRDIQTVAILSTDAAIRALGIAHVTERSLPVNGRYRMLWTGAAAGTVVGDEDTATSLRGIASGISNERVVFVNATRATYTYLDADTKEELSTTVEGDFIAAALAAYRDSFTNPTTTLLNRTIPGITLLTDDYNNYYSEYQLSLCGGSSVFIMDYTTGGTIRVLDDLTTDNSTVERNNINIITAKDYIAKDVAIQMDRTFKGTLIKNRGAYQSIVQNYLGIIFGTYKKNNIIESIGTLSASLPTDRRDTINIYYSYYAVYTAKYFEGEYAIEI